MHRVRRNVPEQAGVARAPGVAPAPVSPTAATLLAHQANGGNQMVLRLLSQGAPSVPGAELESRIRTRLGGGESLAADVRADMESGFGRSVGDVRIHRDATAAGLSAELNARTFTTGRDVFFGAGAYDSTSRSGRATIAHELVHTMQPAEPGGSEIAPGVRVSRPSDHSERAASAAADALVARREPSVAGGAASAGSDAIAVRRQSHNDAPGPLATPAAPERRVFDVPVVFIAEPANDAAALACQARPQMSGGTSTSAPPSLGVGGTSAAAANMFAHGEHAFTSAPVSRMATWQYWSPMVPGTGPRSGIILERGVNAIPRDLSPQVVSELANFRGTGPMPTWGSGGQPWQTFTPAQLESIPSLVRRLNSGATLAPQELALLSRAAELHIGGGVTGSPFSSFALPGTDVGSVGDKLWRVQVEIDPSTTLNVADTQTRASQLLQVENVAEREVMATTDDTMRILSVESTTGTPGRAGASTGARTFSMRNASTIRWAGRGVLFVSLAYSGYRVATAEPGQGGRVAGEEVGSQLLGWAGAAAAGALCVGFGIATGGAGLLVCGMVGGMIGGFGGSALGGVIGGAFDPATSGGATSSASGPMGPVVPAPSAADPFGLQQGQQVPIIDFLGHSGVAGQLSGTDRAVITSWLNAR